MAGGQSLMPMLALRLARPSVLVDLNRIDALTGIDTEDGNVRVGALTRQRQALTDPVIRSHLPGLAATTRWVGHYQTRNRGTVGGSVALADPAAEYPAFALALDAVMEAASQRGTRSISVHDFFSGLYTTALAPDELLTAIRFPRWTPDTRFAFDEIARRTGDFALVGIAMALQMSAAGTIEKAGIAWCGMGPTAIRAPTAEQALAGQDCNAIDAKAVAALAVGDADPGTDTQASRGYRLSVGRHLAARTLESLLAGEAPS